MAYKDNRESVDRRHLSGFRRIQSEVLKALKGGVPPKEYRAVAAAYKDAVAGERMVLGLEGGRPVEGWPEGIEVRWVDDEEEEAGGVSGAWN